MAFYDNLLLRTVHICLWLFSVVYAWLNNLKKRLGLLQFHNNQRKRTLTLRSCREESRSASKFPHHLSLVVVDGEICYPDIASIIVWCVAMGISNISVFDSQGLLKKNIQELKNNVKLKKKEVLGAEESKFTLEICIGLADSFSNSIDDDTRTIAEHFLKDEVGQSKSRLHFLKDEVGQSKSRLHIICPDDGQVGLVRLAQQYCTERTSHRRGPDDEAKVHSDICDAIQNSYSFPDPDLIIKFGPVSSLLGFLPWQIRLTEIISYPSHVGIDYNSFLALLRIYSKTEKRFGK